ncbi:MAG: hypothetical protein OER96_09850 [Gammaproteobacteria bacterium]|nr:hypothetical protein [Gammaproteobacteria bacterium]
MKIGYQIIVMLVSIFNMTSLVLADSTFLYLHAKYEYGVNSRTQLDFGIGTYEQSNNSSLLSLARKPTNTIALYSSTIGNKMERLYLNEESQSLCQRNSAACITLGAIIGAGAIYVLSEANKDFDNGNIEININTRSE